ncbi:MAG: hypothetical protein K0A94_06445 [Desulfuromonadales bacterium]|nr:hypothetical protein [Desulfuromonadales bacterium]
MLSNNLKSLAICLWLTILLGLVVGCTTTSSIVKSAQQTKTSCSGEWYQSIEEKVTTGDGHGHGPDIGSEEWRSVVEFKLGIRGKATVPQRDSEAWCRYIDHLVQSESSFNN